jgi:hypothetical protein
MRMPSARPPFRLLALTALAIGLGGCQVSFNSGSSSSPGGAGRPAHHVSGKPASSSRSSKPVSKSASKPAGGKQIAGNDDGGGASKPIGPTRDNPGTDDGPTRSKVAGDPTRSGGDEPTRNGDPVRTQTGDPVRTDNGDPARTDDPPTEPASRRGRTTPGYKSTGKADPKPTPRPETPGSFKSTPTTPTPTPKTTPGSFKAPS